MSWALRQALTDLLASPHLVDLTIDGWRFPMHLSKYYNLIFASPSLRRVKLRRAFLDIYKHEDEDLKVPPADLEYFELDVDWDVYGPDYPPFPPFPIISSKGLRLRYTVKLSFQEEAVQVYLFRRIEQQLIHSFVPTVNHLELDVRDIYSWNLEHFTNLESLVIRKDPDTLLQAYPRWMVDTIRTLKRKNKLQALELTLTLMDHEGTQLWIQLLESFVGGEFPALKTLHLQLAVSDAWDDSVLRLDLLEAVGINCTYTICLEKNINHMPQ
ncbi:hypothetical protein CC1G_02321 [Coprinopsis cinerea okayama7|uniref:F-box domain-containing protein n=1 Tax=Coprinopsis cinerea (strain Okayama-7 / 130 / ATCC MYA-4618 / FGSC 9003) TaxID=240176 RepID=A8N7R4_COPC7|nr:hypothetical protein CC1G_02321 [Coprinopsis cinerea okayama7\|eukprot:XP_001830870.2 hypothetical protein CC1G_02321 [Coprinopsis cinerea okayama7\